MKKMKLDDQLRLPSCMAMRRKNLQLTAITEGVKTCTQFVFINLRDSILWQTKQITHNLAIIGTQ
jgi:hypothetical protein